MAQEAVDVCLRMLKESNKRNFDSYSVRNSVLIISHITFRDCRVHIFADNLSQNSCIPHAHHETHLHPVKVATILIPSFHDLRKERVAYKLGPTDKKETTAFLESRSAYKFSLRQIMNFTITLSLVKLNEKKIRVERGAKLYSMCTLKQTPNRANQEST